MFCCILLLLGVTPLLKLHFLKKSICFSNAWLHGSKSGKLMLKLKHLINAATLMRTS